MPLERSVLADDPHALAEGLRLLDDLAVVGADVERADWDRYYRAAALIQIGGAGRVVLVDPLALPDLSAVDAFLRERTVVLHAMENDLVPLGAAGIRCPRVEDTAIAAALLGLPTGLESLLSTLLGVELGGDKAAMQRADWEARPLSEDMLAYAAGDVADLPELWDELARRLADAGREDWYRQELEAALATPPAEARRDWTRTKGAGRLDPLSRSRLRALWERREQVARETDTAPGRIASDKVLLELAVRPPKSAGDLGRRGVRRQAVREFGHHLLDAVAVAAAEGPDPQRRSLRAPAEVDRIRADRLRVLRAERAAAIGLDAGVLCPSRTLMGAVLADPQTPDELRAALGLRAWQWEQLGAAFCEVMGLDGAGKPPAVDDEEDPPMAELLNPDALHHNLDQLPGWEGTRERIGKTYRFADEQRARAFVEAVMAEADAMDHHPTTDVNGGDVRLELWTHSAGGVTQLDLDLAAKIEGLPTA